MTRSGQVVSLPFDLRLSFARFVARTQMADVRRYCIAPVSPVVIEIHRDTFVTSDLA
jgi:hypothetical protein